MSNPLYWAENIFTSLMDKHYEAVVGIWFWVLFLFFLFISVSLIVGVIKWVYELVKDVFGK